MTSIDRAVKHFCLALLFSFSMRASEKENNEPVNKNEPISRTKVIGVGILALGSNGPLVTQAVVTVSPVIAQAGAAVGSAASSAGAAIGSAASAVAVVAAAAPVAPIIAGVAMAGWGLRKAYRSIYPTPLDQAKESAQIAAAKEQEAKSKAASAGYQRQVDFSEARKDLQNCLEEQHFQRCSGSFSEDCAAESYRLSMVQGGEEEANNMFEIHNRFSGMSRSAAKHFFNKPK